jgi:hypothetical protein
MYYGSRGSCLMEKTRSRKYCYMAPLSKKQMLSIQYCVSLEFYFDNAEFLTCTVQYILCEHFL